MKITIPKLKKYILLSLLALGLIIIFQTVFAQVTIPSQYKPEYAPAIPIKINSPNSGASFVNYLLQLIAGSLINIAAPVAILIIAVAGLLAVISHGNATLQGKVKKTIGGAVIGLLIIILSWVIIQTIITFALQATGNINSTPATSPPASQSTPATPPPAPQSTPAIIPPKSLKLPHLPRQTGGPKTGGPQRFALVTHTAVTLKIQNFQIIYHFQQKIIIFV